MSVCTRNRLLVGIVVGAVVIILLTGYANRSPYSIQSAILFFIALLSTYTLFWTVDRYHLF